MSFIILLFCHFVQCLCNVLFFLLQELNVKRQTLVSNVIFHAFSLCWREKLKEFPLIPKIPYNMTGQRNNRKIANGADIYAGTLIFDCTASGQELSLQEAI